MSDLSLQFKQGQYASGKFDNSNQDHLSHEPGIIYLATTDNYSAYLLYDDGTNFLNIIPQMLGYHNGGTGVDLSKNTPANAVLIQNGTLNGIANVASAKGAFYSTGTNVTPKFGTLPVNVGGTGKTTLTSGGIIYGKGTSAVGVTAKGAKSAILVGGDGTPVFAAPAVSWVAGTTAGPTFRFALNGTNFDAIIPSASADASGIITTDAQTIAGHKTFNNGLTINGTTKFNGGFQIVGGIDAYYNSSSDQSTGSLEVIGGITATMNMRVDGGTIQFKKAGKIQYDNTKDCFNFVFA